MRRSRDPLLRTEKILSRSRFLVMVHAGQDEDDLVLDDIEERVRKVAQNGSPDLAFDTLVQLGPGAQMRLRPFEFLDERCALADVRVAVPGDRVPDLGRRRRSIANGIGHYSMPALDLISASVTVGSSGWAL